MKLGVICKDKEELNFRKEAYLPPYSKLISFIISGNNKFTVERNSIMIKNLIPKRYRYKCKVIGDLKTEIKDAILDGEIKNDRQQAYQWLLKIAAKKQLTPINQLP